MAEPSIGLGKMYEPDRFHEHGTPSRKKALEWILFIGLLWGIVSTTVNYFTKGEQFCTGIKKIAYTVGLVEEQEQKQPQDDFYAEVRQHLTKVKDDELAHEQSIEKLVLLRRQINAVLPGRTLAEEVNSELEGMPAEYVAKKTVARLTEYAAEEDILNAEGDKYLSEKFSENYRKEQDLSAMQQNGGK